MKYKLLEELLPYLDRFDESGQGSSIEDFFNWIKAAPKVDKESVAEQDFDQSKFVPLQGDTNAKISQLISLLYKYVRFYYKKGLKDSLLQTPEDFGFLATLAMYGDLRKKELIQKNTSEFTSGMEVIRRLERHELIMSFQDPNDKRARRVKITTKGQGAFFQALPILRNIGSIATGRLTESEKEQLLQLLQKLNHFHNPIFHDEKESSLTNIVSKYVES